MIGNSWWQSVLRAEEMERANHWMNNGAGRGPQRSEGACLGGEGQAVTEQTIEAGCS